jgi:hypothetical protein
MSFFRSLVLLTGVCLCVAVAYFVGHGISTGHAAPMLYGVGLLLAGAAILAGLSRDRIRW